jgi:hypothetical protein
MNGAGECTSLFFQVMLSTDYSFFLIPWFFSLLIPSRQNFGQLAGIRIGIGAEEDGRA